MHQPIKKNEKSLKISIDFGTSNTGFGWAFLEDEKKTTYNRTGWPSAPVKYAKTRTAIFYRSKKPIAIGWEAIDKAGQCDDGSLIQCFKMDLWKNQTVLVENVNVDPQTICIDFLRLFLNVLVKPFLSDKLGAKYDADQIQWVFSVPSIFDELQRQIFKQICVKAGYIEENATETDFLMVSEPEAVAAYCVQDIKTRQEELRPDDTYIVIDAGGGTVDLSSHVMNAESKLNELTIQSGGPFGSTVLDSKFLEWITSKCPELTTVLQEQESLKIDLLNAWEMIKTGLTKYENRRIGAPAGLVTFLEQTQDNTFYSKVTKKITITEKDFEIIFKEVLEKVKELTESQISNVIDERGSCKYIFAAGGFCQSALLKQILTQLAADNGAILVLTNFSGENVLNGSLLLSLDPSLIRSRKSKFTYGIEASEMFDGSVHDENDCVLEGTSWVVKGIFDIFVKRGASVPVEEIKERKFVIPEGAEELHVVILKSPQLNPGRVTNNKMVSSLGTIVISIKDSRSSEVRVRMQFGKGDILVKVEGPDGQWYNKEVKFEGALLV